MATPTMNFVPVTSYDPLLTDSGRYLAYGTKWGGALGTGVTLTYSFPSGTAYYLEPYTEFSNGWWSTTATEQAAIRVAMTRWSGVADIHWQQVADNSSTVGELRFALGSLTDFAHAYYPSSSVKAGDVWFKHGAWNTDRAGVPPGSYDYLTIIHEVGHALGLKHPFEGTYVMPEAYDSYFYTVMSYTASPWTNDNYASFYPTTPMYYDLVAIQEIYGRNMSHNAGNSIYRFYDGSTYFQTIDDAGGADTIVYAGSDRCQIDLRIGHYNEVSESIRFTGGITSRSTVWIGPGTYIESAIAGNGSDFVVGNEIVNVLQGRGGNDIMVAGMGNDYLYGGLGIDRLYGNAGNDRFVFNSTPSATNVDRIFDMTHDADLIVLENAIFSGLPYTGTLADFLFWKGVAAHDPTDRIIYQPHTGNLLYDPDGTGPRAAVKFGVVGTYLPLDAGDFFVV